VTGYQSGTARVQGMTLDGLGNLWVASFGNNSVVVFLNGNPSTYAVWTGHETFFSFGIAIAGDNTAWVTSSDPAGSIVQLQLNAGTNPPTLTKVREKIIGSENKGILIDSAKNIWVSAGAPYTSEGNGAIHILDQNGNEQRVVKGVGGLDGPWGICFDGAE